MLRDEINRALKGALKERDERRISTLRLVNAAIQNADIEAQVRGRSSLADEELLPVLQKMLKQRQESVEIYEKAGRSELADQERREIEIIKAYLPQEMSDDEIESAIAGTLTQLGASSIKDMGKVMAALKQGYAGRMDFAKASGRVKALLAPGA
ncbi:MAG: GatB/YqeY domain-containing protein [Alphaproteobacteria bacterium]|nr:MAG: GatB/YqeY domain-containing protein [Alphaproteobacteria bacterium]